VKNPVKLVIDTDIGSDVDDALAIAFALLRPELDVLGITTVYGPVAQRTAIVAKLLKTLHRDDVPFATGSSRPLVGEPNPLVVANHYPVVRPGEALPPPTHSGAQDLFRTVIEAHPGEVWLATIGPMTNAALLIRDHPDVASKLKGIICMGAEPTRSFADFNIRMDPEAADIVFRGGLLKFAGTYDVTRRITMDDADLARLDRAGTDIARLLMECVRLWKPTTTKPGPIVYDMCPLAWLFAPELFTTESLSLRVELAPPERRGMMAKDNSAPPVATSVDIEAPAVHELLMDTLTRH
jgi:inosine-uridine nucleoside N-ribohydrolase